MTRESEMTERVAEFEYLLSTKLPFRSDCSGRDANQSDVKNHSPNCRRVKKTLKRGNEKKDSDE